MNLKPCSSSIVSLLDIILVSHATLLALYSFLCNYLISSNINFHMDRFIYETFNLLAIHQQTTDGHILTISNFNNLTSECYIIKFHNMIMVIFARDLLYGRVFFQRVD